MFVEYIYKSQINMILFDTFTNYMYKIIYF